VADLTNYDDPAEFTNTTTECFQVKDTSQVTTAQSWRASDTATVLLSGGGPASGSVVFTLYPSANCTGTALQTFAAITLDSNGQATATYTTLFSGASTVISWRVAFTPSDPTNIGGSTSHCETSSLTINNDIGS
jgi:hypothetical protein